MQEKQVERAHYSFSKYIDKRRWMSVWHQVDELLALQVESVLEIGPGPGILKAVAGTCGLSIKTLDPDPDLAPDYVGSVLKLPFADTAYDVVCAFQVLEHLPFQQSLKGFSEMARVARQNVIISLPDAKPVWRFAVQIPKSVPCQVLLPHPAWPKVHKFDGEHYWEINRAGYALKEVIESFTSIAGVDLVKTYRVKENPYHRFFVFNQSHRRFS
jgi:SAM-dependent methyltransferase